MGKIPLADLLEITPQVLTNDNKNSGGPVQFKKSTQEQREIHEHSRSFLKQQSFMHFSLLFSFTGLPLEESLEFLCDSIPPKQQHSLLFSPHSQWPGGRGPTGQRGHPETDCRCCCKVLSFNLFPRCGHTFVASD